MDKAVVAAKRANRAMNRSAHATVAAHAWTANAPARATMAPVPGADACMADAAVAKDARA